MSHTYTTPGVYEFRDTGIVLMKNDRLLGWILLLSKGTPEMITFRHLHYMKHTTEGIVILASTSDSVKYHCIRYEPHDLETCSLDLYEWIHSIVCPSVELS